MVETNSPTTLIELAVLIEPGHEPAGFQITGGGRKAISEGCPASFDGLATAAELIRAGSLIAPAHLEPLLSKAVASRLERDGENLESWADRVAKDAADADA